MSEIQDHELYTELSIPFESAERANAAIDAFIHDLREIRAKHRIRDLSYSFAVPLVMQDNTVADILGSGHYGDERFARPLAEYALAFATDRHKQQIARAVKMSREDETDESKTG